MVGRSDAQIPRAFCVGTRHALGRGMRTRYQPAQREIEAMALDDALCAWRELLTKRGVFKVKSKERRACTHRHYRIAIDHLQHKEIR